MSKGVEVERQGGRGGGGEGEGEEEGEGRRGGVGGLISVDSVDSGEWLREEEKSFFCGFLRVREEEEEGEAKSSELKTNSGEKWEDSPPSRRLREGERVGDLGVGLGEGLGREKGMKEWEGEGGGD